jgi:hypothetical protein
MTSDDATIETLREIRDGIHDMRTEFIDRLDETNSRLEDRAGA